MNNIICPNCDHDSLKVGEVDDRGEWAEVDLQCPSCKELFTYTVQYHLQSKRIAKETLTNNKGKEVSF